MTRKFIIVILIVLIQISSAFSQTSLSSQISIDTLKSSYSISGELNRVDLSSGPLMNTVSWSSLSPWFINPINFLYTGNPFQLENKSQSIRYTSLPHIGFNYSFGSSGYQNAVLNYSQSFAKNFIMNIDFKSFQSGGILRNSGFKNQDIQLKVLKQWKQIELFLNAKSVNRTFEWNGGITNDSLPLTYSLGLIPVLKSDALSVRKDISIISETKFTIHSDSMIRLGLTAKNRFDSQNRIYSETGNIALMYPSIYVDSFETRDHLQISTQKNELALFLQTKNSKFNLGVEQTFWNFRNGSLYRDTFELAINENIQLKINKFKINQKIHYYFVGRSSNWKSEISVDKKSKFWSISSSWKIENSLPDLFQRHYFSNNTYYQLPTYENQLKSRVDLICTYVMKKSKIELNGSYIYLKKPYFFDGQTWVNSLYNQVNAMYASLTFDYKYKAFSVLPNYSISILPSQLNFYPTHNLNVRVAVQGGIFKNRKLKTYIGFEPRWIGSYSPITIIPSMDLFLLNGTSNRQLAYFDCAVFTGLELNGFKFFARAENLGYFWNNRMLQVLKGYPIPPMQIKLGITWDFWN